LRKQIRQSLNLRYTARGRPHNAQRCSSRELNFGLRLAFSILALLAIENLCSAFYLNGLRRSGLYLNGLRRSGLYLNGLRRSGFYLNGLRRSGPSCG
jgi:hypothetical protein